MRNQKQRKKIRKQVYPKNILCKSENINNRMLDTSRIILFEVENCLHVNLTIPQYASEEAATFLRRQQEQSFSFVTHDTTNKNSLPIVDID